VTCLAAREFTCSSFSGGTPSNSRVPAPSVSGTMCSRPLLLVATSVALAVSFLSSLSMKQTGIELSLIDRHPVEALQMPRHGEIDIALVFRYADAPVGDEGFHLLHIGDDPIYLISQRPDDSLAVNQISPKNATRREVISEPRDRPIHRS
jgi:DNA-binding transcriptional LysR family regulator